MKPIGLVSCTYAGNHFFASDPTRGEWSHHPTEKGKNEMRSSVTRIAVIVLCFTASIVVSAQQPPSSDPVDRLLPKPSDPLPKLLALDKSQVEKLDGIYTTFAMLRLEQEAKMAAWHDGIEQAKAKTPPDRRKVERMERDIRRTEQRIATAFVKARKEGFKALVPIQRDWLKWLWNHHKIGPHDRYCYLLVVPVKDMWKVPVEEEIARKVLTQRAFEARSPREYRYFGAPYTFHSYGYRLNSPEFFNDHKHPMGPVIHW